MISAWLPWIWLRSIRFYWNGTTQSVLAVCSDHYPSGTTPRLPPPLNAPRSSHLPAWIVQGHASVSGFPMFTGTLLLPPPCFQLTRYGSCLKFGPVHFLPVALDFIVNLMIDRLMLAERESELPTRSSYRVHQRQLKKIIIKSIVTVSYGGLNGGLRCEPKFTFGLLFGKTGCEMDITGEFQLQRVYD